MPRHSLKVVGKPFCTDVTKVAYAMCEKYYPILARF